MSTGIVACRQAHQQNSVEDAAIQQRQAMIRELPPDDTEALRTSPMDMPPWYRQRLKKSADMASSPPEKNKPKYVRGYWLVNP